MESQFLVQILMFHTGGCSSYPKIWKKFKNYFLKNIMSTWYKHINDLKK